MDQTDARLKADHIDIQLDPVQRPSDIQKLKIYNNVIEDPKGDIVCCCWNLHRFTIIKLSYIFITHWNY